MPSPDKAFVNDRHALALMLAVVATIVLFQGISVIDTDLVEVWRTMLGQPFTDDPKRLYLVEGLLPNAIGIVLLQLHWPDRAIWLLWWVLGVLSLTASLAFAVKRGIVRLADLLLIITFSRLVDTVSMWIGRSDPYLMSLLVLSASRDRGLSRCAIVLAAFCHPSAAVVSALGCVAVGQAFRAKTDLLLPGLAVVFAVLDIAISHWLVPDMVDRNGFLVRTLHNILVSAAECGLVALVSAIIVPLWSIRTMAANPVLPARRDAVPLMLWLAAVAVLTCAITLDHTRAVCILTLAPLMLYLRLQAEAVPDRTDGLKLPSGFFLLATARLVVPHVAFDGFWLFSWGIVGRAWTSVFHP